MSKLLHGSAHHFNSPHKCVVFEARAFNLCNMRPQTTIPIRRLALAYILYGTYALYICYTATKCIGNCAARSRSRLSERCYFDRARILLPENSDENSVNSSRNIFALLTTGPGRIALHKITAHETLRHPQITRLHRRRRYRRHHRKCLCYACQQRAYSNYLHLTHSLKGAAAHRRRQRRHQQPMRCFRFV